MNAKDLVAPAVALLLAASSLAQSGPASAKAKSASKPAASRLVVVPAADLKWTDLDPTGAPGVKIADVWGDHAKGAFGAFIRLPAGFAAPLHTHTSDYKVVIVSGTYVQVPEGKPEFRLGPGSYLLQPGGNYRHTTSCDPASDCVFFLESGGKFDLKPVAAPVAAPVTSPAAGAQPPSPASAAKVTDPGGPIAVAPTKAGLTRIGAEKCKVCHRIQFDSWSATAHAKRTPPLDCESCHGPGSEYKAMAIMKDSAKAKAAGLVVPTASFCANCHTRGWKDDMLRKAHAHKAAAPG